LKFKSKQTL